MNNLKKCTYLLALIITSAPVFAQSLPYGLKQTDKLTRSSDSEENVLKELEGTFTFAAEGIDHDSHKVALAGAFVADGKGHITKGEEDFNSIGKTLTRLSLEGSYTLNTLHAGTMTLKTSDGATQSFSFFLTPGLANFKSASLVANDSVFGVHGTLLKRTFLPFIDGNYNFNLNGETPDADIMTLAGTLTIANSVVTDSISGLAAIYGHFDKDDPTFISSSPFKGAFVQHPDEFGRFEISLAFSSDGPAASFAAYAVDGFHLDFLSIDKVAEDTPSLSGSAVR
jgi:hypothetical protein